MINLKSKDDCCGCSACVAKCPVRCISMHADEEGFLYPEINREVCIDCGVCEKACPVLENKKVYSDNSNSKEKVIHYAISAANELPQSYVCCINEKKIRDESTSGGAFSVLAEYVLQNKGVVFGAALNDKNEVVHIKAVTREELSQIRRSKYVQSNQVGIYVEVKKELAKGGTVLYTGTPCQVEGLKKYLGREYDGLITMDIFCHGVGSPLYWKKYLMYMQSVYHSKISKIQFREKTYGYNSATMALYFENGRSSHKGHDDDLYWSPFSKNYIYRPSCYACAFKRVNHKADFSVGDFWETDYLPDEFKNVNGCSFLLCHSEKAVSVLENVKDRLTYIPYDLEDGLVINGGHQPSMLITSAPCPERRAEFFDDMEKLNPQQLNEKYMPLSLKKKVKCYLKPLLYKIGILGLAKQLKKG